MRGSGSPDRAMVACSSLELVLA
eukprot:COSAG06_NODE_57355_length_280_cov_1.237569_1_plen_22_part_01